MDNNFLEALNTVKKHIDNIWNKHETCSDDCRFHSICTTIDSGGYMDVATIINRLIDSSEKLPCSCYHTTMKKEPRYNTITGQIDHYEDIEYGICWGTKECEMCSCGGNKKNCDFYEYKRK